MIAEIIENCETCNSHSISIDEPLSDSRRIYGRYFLVVADIVTPVPVFDLGILECSDELFWSDETDFTSRSTEFFACALGSLIPVFCIVATIDRCISSILKMIGEIESSPSCWNILSLIRNPSYHSMSDSFRLDIFDNRFSVDAFIPSYMTSSPQERLSPCIIRRSSIKCYRSTVFEIFSVCWG